jgi:hypothetical protein
VITVSRASCSDVGSLADPFYIGNRDFAARYPDVLREVIDTLAETAVWAEANRDGAAKSLADVTGVDLDIQTIAAGRSSFAIGKITEDIIGHHRQPAGGCRSALQARRHSEAGRHP